jgi:hypothetical protein
MAVLIHELWRENDENGNRIGYTGCLAGPMGDQARSMLGPGATLVKVYAAGSIIEAGTIKNEFLGFGAYTTPWPDLDSQPYPEEWAEIQRKGRGESVGGG